LFGISDDGLGNKGIEIEVWLNRESSTLFFMKCKKRKNKSTPYTSHKMEP